MRPVLLALVLVPACVVLEIHEGNGVSASEDREVGEFSAVRATNEVDVRVVRGEAPSARVTCDENLLDLIVVELDGDTLIVRTGEGGHGAPVSLSPQTACVVELAATQLGEVRASGSGDVSVEGEDTLGLQRVVSSGSGSVTVEPTLTPEVLEVVVSGSGDVRLQAVQAVELAVELSGSGDAVVEGGAVEELDLRVSGSGDAELAGAEALAVHVQLSGSGDGVVTATSSVDGTLSGSGDLHVFGDPAERSVQTTGSGEVVFGE